jgi:hypothetical protein
MCKKGSLLQDDCFTRIFWISFGDEYGQATACLYRNHNAALSDGIGGGAVASRIPE